MNYSFSEQMGLLIDAERSDLTTRMFLLVQSIGLKKAAISINSMVMISFKICLLTIG